ncbi:MAG: shikimate kinase [ANME-2 cluster archaeon]|nr:shikimate kinase [ANME-2 cluster archaeon]MDF1531476.1 shikimate kinase [ANME-2 cluster archaeon]
MTTTGYATALGAGTIINAIATWKGSAFGIDLHTGAEVKLNSTDRIKGIIKGGGNPKLIERCIQLVFEKFNCQDGATVRTTSEVPIASGLKSSSAAANASVLAALDAIGENMEPLDAALLGVQAAKDAGVTITGAFDDAAASMLGGVVITDNRELSLISRNVLESEVIIYAPRKKAYSSRTDVTRSRLVAPWVDMAYGLCIEGKYEQAMTLNGFIYCSALGFRTEPMLMALEVGVEGVSLSGTGPAYTALVHGETADRLVDVWSALDGKVIRTEVNNKGARKGR